MPRQNVQPVRGAIHDVERLKAMSDSPCNIIAVSERTLNIIQNYAIDEVNYTGRYGVSFDGPFYTPVTESDPDYDFVLDVIRRYRLEVNDMTGELVASINSLTATISGALSTSCGCEIGEDVATTDGQEGGSLPDPVAGQAYVAADPITDRKCKAANYIHQGVRGVVEELKLNRADQYGFAGLQFVLTLVTTIVGGLIAGPFGLLVGAVAGGSLSMALGLFKASFSLTLLLASIEDDEAAAVCALYEATTASGAEAAYKAVLSAGGATSVELEFVDHLLPTNVLNLLFFAWGDSEGVIDDVTVEQSCVGCAPVGGCQWEFRDGSLSPPIYGTGTLDKDGGTHTLTAVEIAPNWLMYIDLLTDSGGPGEDCDGLDNVNARIEFVSVSIDIGEFSHREAYAWVGSTRTNQAQPAIGQGLVDRSEFQLTAQEAFSVDIKILPGNF